MKSTANQTTTNKWLNVPIIATIARLLCRELTLQNEYLRAENKILKSNIKKRIVFTDDDRRTLVEAALAMGRDLMEQVVAIVKPNRWQGCTVLSKVAARNIVRKDFIGGLLKSYRKVA
jgi:hypothetical protein